MDDSLTKTWIIKHSQEEAGKGFYELAFGQRPAEELYNRRTDPYQLHNLAGSPEYQAVLKQLAARLQSVQETTNDPRLHDAFDQSPYIEMPK